MRRLIKDIIRRKSKNNSDSIPLCPEGWNLTISDLMQEMNDGKRKQVGHPEIEWAREFERSLIPEDYRFPQKGDLYESKTDQTIEFLTSWAAPFTGGGESTILKGEKIWISSDPSDKKPISTYALPVNYKELEQRMVASSDRNAPKYGGFYFSIKTNDLNENYILIQTGFSKAEYE